MNQKLDRLAELLIEDLTIRKTERDRSIFDSDCQKEFLIKEYETSVELTNHIDELRNKLTSFYLVLAGAAGSGLLVLLKGEARETLISQETLFLLSGLFLLLVSIIGFFVVWGLARLRYVQIQHFAIVGQIRAAFFQNNKALLKAVPLIFPTVLVPNRKSGTYMWLLMVVFTASFLFSVSLCLIGAGIFPNLPVNARYGISGVAFFVFATLLDWIYFKFATHKDTVIQKFDDMRAAKNATI